MYSLYSVSDLNIICCFRINKPADEEKRRPNILSMKESLYQLQQKRLNKEYPWDVSLIPIMLFMLIYLEQ